MASERQAPPGPTTRETVVAVVLLTVIAGSIFYAVATNQPGMHAPAPVVSSAGVAFLLAAMRLVQMRVQPGSSGAFLAALILVVLTGIGGWIAVGPGDRMCNVRISGASPSLLDGWPCRLPFGLGALVTAAMGVVLLVDAMRGRN